MTTISKTSTCPTCGNSINAEATFCIYCFGKTSRGSGPVTGETTENNVAGAIAGDPASQQITLTIKQKNSYAGAVSRRYRDAYVVAGAIIDHGIRLKAFAAVVAIVVVLTFLFVAGNLRGPIALGIAVAGLILGAVLFGLIHTHGVHICAEGQHLLASLDIAVNTSPFLDGSEKAQMMSL